MVSARAWVRCRFRVRIRFPDTNRLPTNGIAETLVSEYSLMRVMAMSRFFESPFIYLKLKKY